MMNMDLYQKYAEYIKENIGDFIPAVGIVGGSGLGNLFDEADIKACIEYRDIPDFPQSTVEGHNGCFLFLEYKGRNIVFMQGRIHYYEGYTMQQVVTPVIVMKLLGIQILILTNASGGVNPTFEAGDIMMITDHISSFVPSALMGENDERLGERFPDMTEIYSKAFRKTLCRIAAENHIDLKKGVYVQASGPNYETPAEVRMFQVLGADAVGMSTACEAMVGKYLGLSVCGLSIVTNKACGLCDTPLSHTEVQKTAETTTAKVACLIKNFIETV